MSAHKAESNPVKSEPSYIFLGLLIRVAVATSFITAPFVLFSHQPPTSYWLTLVALVVSLFSFLAWKFCFPKVKNLSQMDWLSSCLFAFLYLVIAFSAYIQPQETNPIVLIVIASAFTFVSNRRFAVVTSLGLAAWGFAIWLTGYTLAAHDLIYPLIIAPTFAILVRFAYHNFIRLISRMRKIETSQINELKYANEKLESEKLLRQGSEERILQLQKLESLGQLAAGVAHDFNNYLLAISAYAEAIECQAPEVAEEAKEIREVAHQASGICSQMLTFAGKMNDKQQVVSLTGLIAESKVLFETAMPDHCKLEIDLPFAPLNIYANKSQVQQVLINLVANAADAVSSTGSFVRVSTQTLQVTSTNPVSHSYQTGDLEPGDYIQFRVQDDGPGIERETIKQIFDPFYSTKMTGHGLGLAVALGIVEGHNGVIHCTSAPGQGTSFDVYFRPNEKVPDEASVPAESASSSPAQGRLLVVDDDIHVLQAVNKMLVACGWEVNQQESGKKAIQHLQDVPYDYSAIVLDYSMPEMDGLQLLDEIRGAGFATPVILCSGFPVGPDPVSPNGFRPDAFLRKPFRRQKLQEVISSLSELTASR